MYKTRLNGDPVEWTARCDQDEIYVPNDQKRQVVLDLMLIVEEFGERPARFARNFLTR